MIIKLFLILTNIFNINIYKPATALGHECAKGYGFDEYDESDECYELMTLMADE